MVISFALAVSQYARQKQFTQGLTNRLSEVNLGLVATGFGLLIEDMTMTATFFVLCGVTVAEHGSGLGQPNRAWLRGWLD